MFNSLNQETKNYLFLLILQFLLLSDHFYLIFELQIIYATLFCHHLLIIIYLFVKLVFLQIIDSMHAQSESIGIMEGAFFVPKSQLINWVNELLKISITKIQQLGTGAVYCQILDVMHPGKIQLQRVSFNATNEWQFINNFKLLQLGFSKCKILKYIDIQKLSKSKYQDNLEFIQWMKRYFDLHNKTDLKIYDPQAARKYAEVDFSFVDIRNPLKKQQKHQKEQVLRGKSKSPYANVKSKINSRSMTLGSNIYLKKLTEIRKIINNKKPEDKEEKLAKIQQIIEQIEEQLPQPCQSETQIKQMKNLSTVPSKKIVTSPKKKLKTVVK